MAFYEQDVDVLIDAATVQSKVRELGAQITRDYAGRELTLVGIMKGSLLFLADLSRAIDLPITIELMGASSYAGIETTGEMRLTHDFTAPIDGRNLLVIEDIVDTGLTARFVIDHLQARHPASLKVCALIEKPSRARTSVAIDYKGFVIEDRFVVGYGLDHSGKYRNLPFVGVMRSAMLSR